MFAPIELGLVLLGLAGSLWEYLQAWRQRRQARPPRPPHPNRWQRLDLWGKEHPFTLGSIFLGLTVVFSISFYLETHESTQITIDSPPVHQPGGTTTVIGTPAKASDQDGDGVPDSRDRCFAVPAATATGCPPKPRVHSLHPGWGPPEKALNQFVERRLGEHPCEKAGPVPRLATAELRCSIRGRQLEFLRFRSWHFAHYYLAVLRDQRARHWPVGRCRGTRWHLEDPEPSSDLGPLSFLRRKHEFIVAWGYWSKRNQRNLVLIRGPLREAGAICAYWSKASP
jgi:hypothetical protein